jgi:hypothetical protein
MLLLLLTSIGRDGEQEQEQEKEEEGKPPYAGVCTNFLTRPHGTHSTR